MAGGYADGTFQPAKPVTRAEFVKMAVSGLGIATQNPTAPTFADIVPGGTFYVYVEGAYAAGLVKGNNTPAGTVFGPDTYVSRQQTNSILGRYLSGNELGATVVVRVATSRGTSIETPFPENEYTYTTAPPAITYVNTVSGTAAGGDTVTIGGSHLTGITAVMFGDTAATRFWEGGDDSHVYAIAPAHAPGAVDVRVTTPNGTSALNPNDVYTYVGS